MSNPQAIVNLVDDDPSHLLVTARLLRAHGYVVRTFSNCGDFLKSLASDAPGCAVVDLQISGMGGLELQAAIAHTGLSLPVIFLTGEGDFPSCVHAMRMGAEDFLDKRASEENLIEAIHRALTRSSREHELRARFKKMTKRELQVLTHVVLGKMNKEIAEILGINIRTVKLHRTAITSKAGVASVAELTTLARDAKLFATENGPLRD